MRLIAKGVDPYTTQGRAIRQVDENEFHAYFDGWFQGESSTYYAAVESLFPESTHGYEIEYFFDEGDYLHGPYCGECAAQMWASADDELNTEGNGKVIAEMINSDQLREGSVWCDGCSKEIAEQVCAECYLPLSENLHQRYPMTFYDGNYTCLHATCVAKLVVDGEASKVGLGQYRIPKYGYVVNPDTGVFTQGRY